jgi:serine/threonine protein phosphatase PrpC
MPIPGFLKKKPKNSQDIRAEPQEAGTGDESAQTAPPAPSEPEESTETAEQQVNTVEAEARFGAYARADARAQPQERARIAESRTNHGPFPGRYPVWGITINHDHHGEGRGEDAPPLWRLGLIGVFDGLGGAGGELVKVQDGTEQTGAWLASRVVGRQVASVYDHSVRQDRLPRGSDDLNFYGDGFPVPELYQEFDFTAEIRRAIQEALDSLAQRIRATGGGSRIRSKLIKILPTTLAVCTYDLDKNEFTSIWAGDSRVFYLRPDTGLLQVTTDDLRTNADALKNLIEDSPMSNCVSAEADFVLHERRHALRPFSILLAATDGCFGYVQTPLHFEHLLLSTMREAVDWEDWQSRLEAAITRVTGDDCTLAAAIIGWESFVECRERFGERAAWCEAQVRGYDEVHGRVRSLERELDQARRELEETKSALWEEYRRTYEMPAGTQTRDVPKRQQIGRPEPGTAGADHSPGAD